jgi:energy-converting hydrogenase B subunit D
MFEIINLILIIGLLACAILVVRLRSLVSAIMAFSCLGTFLTLLFLLMQAPDVALSEAAVGTVAVPLVLLIALVKIRSLLDDPSEAE